MQDSCALPEQPPTWREMLLSREGKIMTFASVCLLVLWKFGRNGFFNRHFADKVADWWAPELWQYVYMNGMSVVMRLVLPLLFILFVLREHPRDFGHRINGTGGLGKIYLFLLAFMVPLLWLAAGTEAFQHKYPFYDGASETWRQLLVYEAAYLFVFLSGESFWRGFLVLGLKERYGVYAIAISMVPYVMVHFGKPMPETFGAIITAFVLGYLSYKHGAYWLGVALHFSIAFLMDMFVMIRTGTLPEAW